MNQKIKKITFKPKQLVIMTVRGKTLTNSWSMSVKDRNLLLVEMQWRDAKWSKQNITHFSAVINSLPQQFVLYPHLDGAIQPTAQTLVSPNEKNEKNPNQNKEQMVAMLVR